MFANWLMWDKLNMCEVVSDEIVFQWAKFWFHTVKFIHNWRLEDWHKIYHLDNIAQMISIINQ